MNVYHECRGAMHLLQPSEKRLRYHPNIDDMLREPPGSPVPARVKYWQPYVCRDCPEVVYELCE